MLAILVIILETHSNTTLLFSIMKNNGNLFIFLFFKPLGKRDAEGSRF